MVGIQLHTKTTAERLALTRVNLGDFIIDSDEGNIYMGDGGTAGGLLIGGVEAGISAFSGMQDTPNSYVGQGLKYVRVKANESGLEFVDAPAGGSVESFTDISDVPSAYTTAFQFLRVNSTTNGLEFFTPRLRDISDVQTAGAQNGYGLYYNSVSQLWEAGAAPASGATAFTGLTDTAGSLGAVGTFARMISGTTLGFSTADLNALDDVNIGTPAANQVITWDTGSGKWINAASPADIDVVLDGAAWDAATMTITLQQADPDPDIDIVINHAIGNLSNVNTTGVQSGSVLYYKAGSFVVTGAPSAANQAIKWDGTDWVYEDVLIVDNNVDPEQDPVADSYAAGTILVADDAEDSFNPLPAPGTASGQALRIASNGLPKWLESAHQYTDRATAVADSTTWADAEFPCVMVIEQDKLLGEADLAPVKQAWLLLAAPSATANVANEIPLGPRQIGDNGQWLDANYEPFNNGTHPVANALARASRVKRTVVNAGTTSYDRLLPDQGVVGYIDIPTAEIVSEQRTNAYVRMAEGVLISKAKLVVMANSGTDVAAGDIPFKLTRVDHASDISTAADFSALTTLSSGSRNATITGVANFSAGFGGEAGLLREDDKVYVTFGTAPNSAANLRLYLYGFKLGAPQALV